MRDEQMRRRADDGARPDEIAREFGVSISTVYRAVNAAA
jgi:transposase